MDYCEQDVTVTHAVGSVSPTHMVRKAIDFEHELAELCHRIGRAGWTLTWTRLQNFIATCHKSELTSSSSCISCSAWTVEEEFIPKRNNKTKGYIAGEPFIKHKTVEFNANSRKHIGLSAPEIQLKPDIFTPTGIPRLTKIHLATCHFQKLRSWHGHSCCRRRVCWQKAMQHG